MFLVQEVVESETYARNWPRTQLPYTVPERAKFFMILNKYWRRKEVCWGLTHHPHCVPKTASYNS